jgi:ABC-type sugar transport system ATPase subunit
VVRVSETYAAVGVGKSFSGVTVLDGVDLELEAGKVHALLGENGSGKSTLIKVLSGVHPPTAGHVERNGEQLALRWPADAQRAGLAVVHQDYNLFPDLDVATNVSLASGLPVRRLLRALDRRELRRRVRAVLESLDSTIDPRELVRNLRLAEWKLIEIARALMTRPTFVVLDEPTALLDRRDSQTILALVEGLRAAGVGVAFVTHRLDESLRVGDVATVLRDGRRVATLPTERLTQQRLVELIVGEKGWAAEAEKPDRREGHPVVELSGVRALPDGRPFDLVAREGGILGLTGLVGSGAIEVAQMLAGRRQLDGTVRVDDRERRIRTPTDAIRAGIGYIPEERESHGLVSQLSVEVNLNLASLGDVSRSGIVSGRLVRARARRFAAPLLIRAPSLGVPVRTLSGGNQQKVQIAKWLAANRRILVVESPTHGVDVGAKVEIQRLLREFAAGGGTVVVASTDIPEVLSLADRVAVFSRGDLVDVIPTTATSHAAVLLSGARAPELDVIERLVEN